MKQKILFATKIKTAYNLKFLNSLGARKPRGLKFCLSPKNDHSKKKTNYALLRKWKSHQYVGSNTTQL